MVTKAKQKDDTKEEEEEGSEEEESGADKDSEGSGSDDDRGGDLESHIRKVVSEVVDSLLGNRSENTKSSPAQDEKTIFRMVKDAQQTLKKEEDRDSLLKTTSETVEELKKAVERAPARNGIGGKLQRFMWGSDE